MKKSAIALLLCTAVLALTLSSCSLTARVKVNGVRVDNEVYDYFEASLKGDGGEEASDEAVKASIVRYVAINSEFDRQSLALNPRQKAELSARVNDIWHLYGSYYEDLKISKQTVYKIEQSKEYEKSLLEFYYGENGASPVNEDEIKQFFTANYIAVRFVTGYLFNLDDNGVKTAMTDSEKSGLTKSFGSAAEVINGGTAIEQAAGSLGENTKVNDGVVSAFSGGTLPTGFFEEVKGIENGKAAAVTLGDYIFLVQRIDIMNEEYGYYDSYRRECLERMKGEEFAAVIDEWTKNYTAE